MHELSNVLRVLYIIYAGISMCIYVPLSCYGIRVYLRYYNHILLTKRYSKIALLNGILLLVIIILGSAILVIVSLHRNDIAIWFVHPVFSLVVIQMYCFLLRTYLNYYDINYAIGMMNNKWQQIINHTSSSSNWFIQNKAKYGTMNYWIKHLIVAIIFTTMLFYSVFFVYMPGPSTMWHSIYYENVAAFIPASGGIVTIAVIRYKTWKLKFHDNIYFGEEIDRGIVGAIIGVVCNIVILSIIWFILPSFHLNLDLLYFGFSTILFVFMTVFCFWIYLFTIWVISKNAKWLNLQTNFRSFTNLHEMIQYDNQDVQQMEHELSLNDVLLDKNGFQSLINDILKEYSLEIVLCQIEITQFQCLVLQHMNSDEVPNGTIIQLAYPRDVVPQSTIVYGDLPDECNSILLPYKANDQKAIVYELKLRAWLIYQKYIQTGSAFEVNISSAMRYQFIAKMNDVHRWLEHDMDKNVNQHCIYLLSVFRSIMNEQYKLLGYSFSRYQKTAVYQKLQAQLKP
eukprot:179194_1